MISQLDNMLNFYENTLSIRSQRQQLLAANIANADTPHYKARDLDFSKAMDAVMSKANADIAVRTNSTYSANEMDDQSLHVFERKPFQNSADGNTVDMDIERNAYTENGLLYEADVTIVHEQIKNLLSVLQG
jgi:flagellar basal-body rod protein FlgB